jgi:hypothetical protein
VKELERSIGRGRGWRSTPRRGGNSCSTWPPVEAFWSIVRPARRRVHSPSSRLSFSVPAQPNAVGSVVRILGKPRPPQTCTSCGGRLAGTVTPRSRRGLALVRRCSRLPDCRTIRELRFHVSMRPVRPITPLLMPERPRSVGASAGGSPTTSGQSSSVGPISLADRCFCFLCSANRLARHHVETTTGGFPLVKGSRPRDHSQSVQVLPWWYRHKAAEPCGHHEGHLSRKGVLQA